MAVEIKITGQFNRSVSLVRDFYDERGGEGYIVTARSRELLDRMLAALEQPQAQRAWSVFGPYGGGKSAFALFASTLTRGAQNAQKKLRDSDPELAKRARMFKKTGFLPVLVEGKRRSLRAAILDGLERSISFLLEHGDLDKRRAYTKLLVEVLRRIEGLNETCGDAEVLDLIEEVAVAVQELPGYGGGVFLVIDELGKLLEYAALHPDESDPYILQIIAERASRTGKTAKQAAPILFVTILHQAFDQYATRLGEKDRMEWRKVQGRFEDFAFIESPDETLRLLASAVRHPKSWKPESSWKRQVKSIVSLAKLPKGITKKQVTEHLNEALPIHPAVALLIGPLFKKLAQNERSLFAFLTSEEPNGFLDVAKSAERLYGLEHLYQYISASLGSSLYGSRVNRIWTESDAALARLNEAGPYDEQVLMQIALLGYVGDYIGLSADKKTLLGTSGLKETELEHALDNLVSQRILVFRRATQEYRIWEGSDYDLAERLTEARKQVSTRETLDKLIHRLVPPIPILAKRHAMRTGTMRHFEVLYASARNWQATIQKAQKADGRILFILPDAHNGPQGVLDSIQEFNWSESYSLNLLAVPNSADSLLPNLQQLAALEWLRRKDSDLESDVVARKEVNSQLNEIKAVVEASLRSMLDANSKDFDCTWVHQGLEIRLENERGLQTFLSDQLDKDFYLTPEVTNELVNRSKPSSSAMRGLKVLLQAILENSEQDRLGFEGYPAEFGLYESLLRSKGLHRIQNGKLGFYSPQEGSAWSSVWSFLEDLLHDQTGSRVPVEHLYEALENEPVGIRRGLIPILLFAFAAAHREELAFYEEGVFTIDITYEFIGRLLKNPNHFAVQFVPLDNARAEVLEALAPLVGLPDSVSQPLPIVLKLLQHIRSLKPYVLRTQTLNQQTIAVRECLKKATDPAELIFEQLPGACSEQALFDEQSILRPDGLELYISTLQYSLRELSQRYDHLCDELVEVIASAFDIKAKTLDSLRTQISKRAKLVMPFVTDVSLKAFCVRATDEVVDSRGWLESICALVAKKAPAQWTDSDYPVFRRGIAQLAQKFMAKEPLAFDLAKKQGELPFDQGDESMYRISVVPLHGEEAESIIEVTQEDESSLSQIEKELLAALNSVALGDHSSSIKLAALARLAQKLIREREDATTRFND